MEKKNKNILKPVSRNNVQEQPLYQDDAFAHITDNMEYMQAYREKFRSLVGADVSRIFEEIEQGKWIWPFNRKEIVIVVKDDAIVVQSDHEACARKAVHLAKEKGWECIDLSQGTDEFRKTCWLEAQALGIQTVGYKPTLEDKQALEKLIQSNQESLQSLVQEKQILEAQANYSPDALQQDHPDSSILREMEIVAEPVSVLDRLTEKVKEQRKDKEFVNPYQFKP